ncbi:hypothetical protein [Candidatus Methanomethylophilus sp. 1R26]
MAHAGARWRSSIWTTARTRTTGRSTGRCASPRA